MGTVVEFPCRARAANDADVNPWLSSEPLPAVEPVEAEPQLDPKYGEWRTVTDEISGVTYRTIVPPGTPPEKKSHWKFWCFLIGCALGFGTF